MFSEKFTSTQLVHKSLCLVALGCVWFFGRFEYMLSTQGMFLLVLIRLQHITRVTYKRRNYTNEMIKDLPSIYLHL